MTSADSSTTDLVSALRSGAASVEVNGVHAIVARSFLQRARGLLGRCGLEKGTGMLIMRCNCIHTCFMRFPIDAVFLDARGEVVRTVRGIRPWRLCVWGGWRARMVLELDSRNTASH